MSALTLRTFIHAVGRTAPIARGILTTEYEANYSGGARVTWSDTQAMPHIAVKKNSAYASGKLRIIFPTLAAAEAARSKLSTGGAFTWTETTRGVLTESDALKRGPFAVTSSIRVRLEGPSMTFASVEFEYQELPA